MSVKNVVLIFSYWDRSHFSEKCGTFSGIERDYSTPLITVYREISTQQKLLPNSVNNVVLIFSYGYRLLNPFNYCMQWNLNPKKNILPLQWTMWYLFSVMDTDYSTSLITVCSDTLIKKMSFHFSEQSGTFFQLWRHIPLQWTMWYFFQLWRQITQPL